MEQSGDPKNGSLHSLYLIRPQLNSCLMQPHNYPMAQKAQKLSALATARRAAQWAGYRQVDEFHSGLYASEYVSPYTKGAHNPDAEVFLLLQDWSSEKFLSRPPDLEVARLGRSPLLPTNRNLSQLLSIHFGLDLEETYTTNLFPFIKPDTLSASIPMKDLVRAAKEFALPQIQAVQPRVVVCLGLDTFRAVQISQEIRPAASVGAAIDSPFRFESAEVWCQSHPGALGRINRNRGGANRVSQDWRRMSVAVGLGDRRA